MRPSTLKETIDRIADGQDEPTAWAGLLDEFLAASTAERAKILADEPLLTGNPRLDSFVGAVAEYLSKKHNLGASPGWAFNPQRSLPEPWFATSLDGDGIREYLSWSTPPEFLHRNIFTDEAPLRRARDR